MAFSVPIQDSAPHIYISAIPFTPKNSELHHEGRTKYAGALAVTQGLEEVYAGLPRTLRGHQLAFNAVAISPDGSCIVSGSSDWTIRIWDADTGQPLGEPLRGHALQLLTVAISPEGPKIVSDSRDMTIRLWDVGTGQQLGETLQGHTHSVWLSSPLRTAPRFSLVQTTLQFGCGMLTPVDRWEHRSWVIKARSSPLTSRRMDPELSPAHSIQRSDCGM